jgi:osmotically-inducible protein OsmY
MYKYFNLIIIFSALPLLQGCIPAALVGGSATLGSSLAEERKFSDVISDAEIQATINTKWLKHDPKISEMVSLQVREGRVLLTGHVDRPLRQIDAVRLAWEARGVKEVIDETKLGDNSLKLYANDAWITTKLQTEMLFDQDISSINYNIKTVGGVIYLIGIAQNQQELDQVIQMARNINGVKNIVNHVRLKDGSLSQGGDLFPADNTASIREEAPIEAQPASNGNYNSDNFPAPRAS